MNRIRDKDVERLATILQIGQVDLMKLVSMGLIDHKPAMRLLVKYSYQRLKRKKYYKVKQIISAVAMEYGVSERFVRDAIYSRQKRLHYCVKCMRKISASDAHRNNGLCDECFSQTIQIE